MIRLARTALFMTLAFALIPASRADIVSTFEDLNPGVNNFNNNAGPSGQFVSGGNSFNNSYSVDPVFGPTWSGWSISSTTDSTTPGFGNQYAAVTGGGANGSATYAVADTFGDGADPFHPATSVVNLAAGGSPSSIQVTNTTYAYESMLNGDQFAKKFDTGDFFLLSIVGHAGANGTGAVTGEVDFYLANFLNGNDYIVNTWQTVDLSSLAGSGSLAFGLSSSDNNPLFGMNTPAYFAADNLVLTTAVPEPTSLLLMASGVFGVAAWKRKKAA